MSASVCNGIMRTTEMLMRSGNNGETYNHYNLMQVVDQKWGWGTPTTWSIALLQHLGFHHAWNHCQQQSHQPLAYSSSDSSDS